MPPKRPVEVLVLDSDSDNDPPPSTSRLSASSRPISRSNGAGGPSGAAEAEEQFERELAQAMALSLAQEQERARASTSGNASGQRGGGAGESRAEMERMRLERQKQREAAGGGSSASSVRTLSSGGGNKRARVATLADLPGEGEGSSSSSSAAAGPSTSSSSTAGPSSVQSSFSTFFELNTSGAPSSSSSVSSSSASSKSSQRFWSGAIKRVPNAWHPDPDSWSFSDLIGSPPTLQAAIVSAFCLDPGWVVPHFPEDTPLLLIMPRTRGDTGPDLAKCDLKENTFRVIPPNKAPGQFAGVMHIKLMVYVHSSFIRIIIPTANAVPYDWAEMDNALYVHDFPLRSQFTQTLSSLSSSLPSSTTAHDDRDPFKNTTHTQFSKSFLQVLYKLGTPKKFISYAAKYDFGQSGEVRLVQSLQGRYSLQADPKEAKEGGGIVALARAVESFGFAQGGRWEIEATGSSIGNYSSTWLSQFFAACQGVSPMSYFKNKGKELPPSNVVPLQPKGMPVKLPIKVVFPTEEEMLRSWKGAAHGGTLFCPSKTWKGSTFPRHLFHRGLSKRDRVPAHTKIIVALHKFKENSSAPAKHEGWFYLGSHNFTPSAWGQPQNGQNGPRIAINNYELGIVLPIRASSAEDLEKKASEMATFNRPLVPYSSRDEPWQQEKFLRD
ncbi:hypothetical protein JCM8547_009086 [Rhodosporidiobolus lusitaniae]